MRPVNLLIITIIITLVLPAVSFAQQTGYMDVKGRVKDLKTNLADAIVVLYEGPKQISSFKTLSDGKFTLKLNLNTQYTLHVSKDGYVTKKVLFDTKAPDEKVMIYPYSFTVELFQSLDVVDANALKDPVTKIKYSGELGDFDFDAAYTESMKKEIDRIINLVESAKKNAYTQLITKADQFFKDANYEEAIKWYEKAIDTDPYSDYPDQKIMEAEKLLVQQKNSEGQYNKYIAAADAAFNTKDYTVAKDNYTKAIALKPKEKYPTDKIAECNSLLANQKSEEETKKKEAAYKAAIAKGDAAFNQTQYSAAKTAYNEAIGIKPDEAYPKQKIAEIDKLLADADAKKKAEAEAKAKEDSYKAAIAKADAAFNIAKYPEAKTAYNEALGIKTTEAYPKQKIAEIDKLLADADAKKKAEAEAKAKEDAYKAAIAKGDAAFNTKKWAEAKTGYNEALTLKPGEKYPTDKLAAIATQEKVEAEAKAKEDAYKTAIAKADAAFGTQKYAEAKTAYNEALGLKPAETYPKQKIAEIDKLLADADAKKKAEAEAKAKEEAYNTAIAKGDAAFNTKKWAEAKTGYNQALAIKPGEKYPTDKLAAIATQEKAEAEAKAKEDSYKTAIAKADAALGTQKYAEAKTAYNEALGIKPNEAYPKQKIAEIDKLLADADAKKKAEAESKAKEDAYKTAIAKGDAAFNSKNWAAAKTGYNEALAIKPGEKYPTDKLAAIATQEKAEAEAKAKEDAYKTAIAKADAAFGSQKYTEAKTAYNEALGIKPGEAYPTQKISEIDKLLADADAKKKAEAEAKAKEDAYKAAIAKGDAAFNSNKYPEAKTAYNEALGIKPNEAYPKQKIAEIDKLLADADAKKKAEAEAKAKEDAYKAAIAKSDAAFNTKKWAEAKAGYNEALAIKPGEKYPTDKLAAITAQELADADAKAKDDAYKAAIAKADAAMGTQKYSDAKDSYNEALRIKPAEAYPKQKIAEIDKLIADADAKKKAEAEAKAKDDAYKAAVAKADAAFNTKNWTDARSGYNEALAIKPSEKYPKDKLAAITTAEKAESDAVAKENSYKTAISKGDAAFGSQKYAEAKTAYNEALGLKPSETYPKQKISEIDKILADADAKKKAEAEAKAKEDAYNAAITKGDAAFNIKKWTDAKAGYNQALTLKPGEKYPTDKLAEISVQEKAEAESKAKEDVYKAAITKADAAFTAKKYTEAKTAYNEALSIKPGESYPIQKISEIDKLLADADAKKKAEAETKAKDDLYKAAIAKGDAAFNTKKWIEAKTGYNEALAIKPGEKYPTDKLAAIAAQEKADADAQAKAQAVNEAYNNKIKEADALYDAKSLEDAKTKYSEASTIKPSETYPKQRINEIDDMILAQNKLKLEENYTNFLKKGDDNMTAKKYNDAKKNYEMACKLKPNETYPKNKLVEIENILTVQAKNQADQAAKDQAYQKALSEGDGFYTKKDYPSAIASYRNASNIKPGEEYPKKRIVECQDLIKAAQQQLEEIDFTNKEVAEKYLSELARKYPEGITTENYEATGGKKIRRIIVNRSGVANDYREVTHSFGGVYYFKNGESVSKFLFNQETSEQ